MELALILGLEHSGYDHFSKGGSWPEEAEEKKELIKRICQLDKVPKGSISTVFMEPKVKILHKLLVNNFIQRGAKPSYVQHEDLLILDKILKREKINLPKLMIYQMNHIKNLSQIGFSRVIKKILKMHKLYEVKSDAEVPMVKEFDPDVFRKMKLVKDPELGWVRTSVVEKSERQGSGFMEEDDEMEVEDQGFGSNVAERLLAVEKGIADLKKDLREVKDGILALLSRI